MNPTEVHPIFLEPLAPFPFDLEPRTCACGQPTDSVALDECEACWAKGGAA